MRCLQVTMSIQRHPTLVRPCARYDFALNLAWTWTWQNPLRLRAGSTPISIRQSVICSCTGSILNRLTVFGAMLVFSEAITS